MGAIYMNLGSNPLKRGSVIHHNFFHGIGAGDRPLTQGVYADDGTMGVAVHSNVFYKVNLYECGGVISLCHFLNL